MKTSLLTAQRLITTDGIVENPRIAIHADGTIASIEVGPWRHRDECRDDDSVGVPDEGSEGMVFGEGRIAREQGIPEFIRRKHGEWGEAQ